MFYWFIPFNTSGRANEVSNITSLEILIMSNLNSWLLARSGKFIQEKKHEIEFTLSL
jgi:hypothetical protein